MLGDGRDGVRWEWSIGVVWCMAEARAPALSPSALLGALPRQIDAAVSEKGC